MWSYHESAARAELDYRREQIDAYIDRQRLAEQARRCCTTYPGVPWARRLAHLLRRPAWPLRRPACPCCAPCC